MKQALVALLFAGIALAGCAEEESAPEPTPPVEAMVPHFVPEQLAELGVDIDATALIAELRQFATDFPQRKGNHADHVASRDWLATQFADAGLEVWRQSFENGIGQENICGLQWGAVPDQWVIVGGHYDMTTTGSSHDQLSTGIYDDGSGTLMTVHLARAFAGVSMDRTVAYCAFDGEERGLQGSGAVADALTAGATDINGVAHNVTIAGMLDLDMIGLNWPGVEAPIFFDDNSVELQAFVHDYAHELGFPEDMVEFRGISAGRSDYAHYFALGVPTGFMISDFEDWQLPANLPANNPDLPANVPLLGTYPFWHVMDTWETMELMAGSEADVIAGFQSASDLAAGVVYFLAADAMAPITAVQK